MLACVLLHQIPTARPIEAAVRQFASLPVGRQQVQDGSVGRPNLHIHHGRFPQPPPIGGLPARSGVKIGVPQHHRWLAVLLGHLSDGRGKFGRVGIGVVGTHGEQRSRGAEEKESKRLKN